MEIICEKYMNFALLSCKQSGFWDISHFKIIRNDPNEKGFFCLTNLNKTNRKLLDFSGQNGLIFFNFFVPLRPGVAKWQHAQTSPKPNFLDL